NMRAPLAGQLNFDFLLQGTRKKPRMSLAIHIAQPQVQSMKLDSIVGQFSYNNQLLNLEQLQFYHGGNSSRLWGKLPVNLALVSLKNRQVAAPLELESEVNNLDLTIFQPFLPDSVVIGGKTSQQLTVSGSWDDPTLAGTLWLQNGSFHFGNGRSRIDSVNAELFFYPDEAIKGDPRVEIRQFQGNLLGAPFTVTGQGWFRTMGIKAVAIGGQLRADLGQLGQLSLEGQKSMGGSIRLHATGRSVNLGYITQLFKSRAQVGGQTSFELNLTGTQQNPFIELTCEAQNLRWQDLVVDSLKGTVSYQNELLQLNQARLVVGSGNLVFHGHLPYVKPARKPSMSGPLMLNSYCENLEVGLLKPLAPSLDNLGGKLAYQLQLTGNLEAPLITGSLQLDQAFLASKKIPVELDNIGMRLRFVQGKAIIDSCYGQLGQGSFSVTGFLEYQNHSLTHVHLISKLSNLKITQPKFFTLAINQGTIEMKDLEDYFQLSGRLLLDETKYTKDFAPQVLLPFARKLGRPLSEPASWMKKTRVDVIFQTGDNLWVDNNIARIKMNANLSLIGTLEQPNLTGRIVALEGYVLYLDRKFKLSRGILDFTDPNKINPQIDLVAESQLKSYHTLEGKEYTITLTLTGTLEKPILTLSSEPFLEKADIVALLTVGRTRQGLLTQVDGSKGSTFKDVVLQRAKEITSQRVVGMAEKTVGDFLDLKSITIEGNLFKADRSWGPRVTATKQITERLDLTYSTVVGHVTEQRIKLNYKLFKQFSIEGETDQQGRAGLDVKYQYKFW
ncbi:MAG: translocation/assembly module TamB domain-containing protein, partial [candidate division KSB1 bacterium]|nr:translocation/assembly module TamB domain-containing protein [candidate division KSB1 bacterium]